MRVEEVDDDISRFVLLLKGLKKHKILLRLEQESFLEVGTSYQLVNL